MKNSHIFGLQLAAALILGSKANPVPNVLPLRRRNATLPIASLSNVKSPLSSVFDVPITFGNQTFQLLVDTGSSDLWVLGPNWQCFNATSNASLPQEGCTYGNATYDPSQSSTFSLIPDEFLGAQYGGGIVSGALGTEAVTLAGITVQNQTFGVVNATSNTGDGVDVGILGLAYPVGTSAHNGSVTTADNTSFSLNTTTYEPLVTNMFKQGLIPDSYFSIALGRLPPNETSGFGGYLGLGVLPPVNHSDTFANTSVVSSLPSEFTNGTAQISLWAITITEVIWGPRSKHNSTTNSTSTPTINATSAPTANSTSTSTLNSVVPSLQSTIVPRMQSNSTIVPGLQSNSTDNSTSNFNSTNLQSNSTEFIAVVDTGNFFTFLPGVIVDSINSFFDPPAILDNSTFPNTYQVACNATAPQLGFKIGNQTFFHHGKDLILPGLENGTCVSALVSQDGVSFEGVQGSILGDGFLKNVVAVFDFGRNEMRFAARHS